MLRLSRGASSQRRLVGVAFVGALSMSVSHTALAACTGTVQPFNPVTAAITVQCTDATTPTSGNLHVTNSTTYVDNYTVGTAAPAATINGITVNTTAYAVSNTTVQFDGHGRELDVDVGASIINNRVITGTTGSRGRTAVLMGASTVNASASTTFASAPTAGASTVSLNATPSTAWVGQTIIFGRYASADSDFFPGSSFKILSVDTVNKTVTIQGTLPANFAGTADASLPLVYGVVSNYGNGYTVNGTFYNNVVNNKGTISASITAAEINADKTGTSSVSNTGAVKGITTTVAGDYLISNSLGASINVSHGGIGNAYAIEVGGNVTTLTVNNSGTVEATRTGTVTLSSISATANATATSSNLSGIAATTLGQVNAINSQEEADTVTVNNSATGVFRATGDYSAALIFRAGEADVTNYGLIEHKSSTGGYDKGYAIGSNSNTGEIRSLSLDNYGTIHGDILAVNGASLRWYLLSTETALAPNGLNDRLTINSQHGQLDSEINNNSTGVIVGNLWYSNGAHTLANAGIISGNIDVDQRDTTNGGTASGALTVLGREDGTASNNTLQGSVYVYRGEKTFAFENAGTYIGNLTITNASSTITNGTFGSGTVNATVASLNTIINDDGATFVGDIKIKDVAGAQNDVYLSGTGFTGNVIATTGAGNNSLSLDGVTNLASVQNFTNLNLNGSNVTVPGGVSLTPAGSPSGYISLGTTIYGAGGTLAAPSTNLGTINGTLTLAGATVIQPTLATAVHNGDVFQVASTVTGAGTGALSVDFSSGLVSLTTDTSTGKLLLEATVANASTISGVSAPGAAAVNGLLASKSTNPKIAALQVAVENLSSPADVRKAAEQLRPESNGASSRVPLEITRVIFNEVNNHLLGSIGAPSGGPSSYSEPAFAAPSGLGMSQGLRSNLGVGQSDEPAFEPRVKGAWVQGFGARLDDATSAKVDGYSADIGGMMGGFDTRVAPGMRVGGGFAVASTTVNDTGLTAGNHQDISTYFGLLYASAANRTGYLNGLIGYGANDYNGSRQFSASGLVDTASQSHNGTQFLAAAEGGLPQRMGFATIVPTASFRYVNLNQDAYTETSKAGMALNISSQQANSAVSGLGLRAQLPLFAASFSSALEGRAMWLHEFGDVVQQVTASFVGGSPAFVAVGPGASRDIVDVGLGLKLASSASDASVVVGYDGAFRDGYTAHAGSVRARIGF